MEQASAPPPEGAAPGTPAAAPSSVPPASGVPGALAGRPPGYTGAVCVYIAYLTVPLAFGLSWIGGLVAALVLRPTTTHAIVHAHYNHQVRLGGFGLLYLAIAGVFGFFLFGLPLVVWWLWTLVKSIQGLSALLNLQAPPGYSGYLGGPG